MAGIVICGGNGSGKSTIAREVANILNYKLMDMDSYYFPNKDSDYKYGYSLSTEEVTELLLTDMKTHKDFIMAAVTGDYGEEINSYYTLAIVIEAPLELRLERVINRSYIEFGDRILPGGDLYEKEKEFFDMVASRPEDRVEKWLNTISCPIIRIDGTKPVIENVEHIIKILTNKAEKNSRIL